MILRISFHWRALPGSCEFSSLCCCLFHCSSRWAVRVFKLLNHVKLGELHRHREGSWSHDDECFLAARPPRNTSLRLRYGRLPSLITTTMAGRTSLLSTARSLKDFPRGKGPPITCIATTMMDVQRTSRDKAGLAHTGWGQGVCAG